MLLCFFLSFFGNISYAASCRSVGLAHKALQACEASQSDLS